MSYTMKMLDGLPALFLSFDPDESLGEVATKMSNQAYAIFEAQSEPIYYLVDARQIKFDFSELMTAIQQSTKGNSAVLKHPNLKQMVVISTSKAVAAIAKGLNTATFGNLNVVVYESYEAALAHIRANAA